MKIKKRPRVPMPTSLSALYADPTCNASTLTMLNLLPDIATDTFQSKALLRPHEEQMSPPFASESCLSSSHTSWDPVFPSQIQSLEELNTRLGIKAPTWGSDSSLSLPVLSSMPPLSETKSTLPIEIELEAILADFRETNPTDNASYLHSACKWDDDSVSTSSDFSYSGMNPVVTHRTEEASGKSMQEHLLVKGCLKSITIMSSSITQTKRGHISKRRKRLF